MPMMIRDPISICALSYSSSVMAPALQVTGLALAGRATRGNDSKFGDFGIMTPLGEPVVP